MHIGDGFGNEHIHIQGSQPRMYHSIQEYLQIMSLASAYAGYIEVAAAQQLYGLSIVVVIAGNAFPAPPQQPPQHTLHVLFHPHSLLYPPACYRANAFSIEMHFSCITP